MTKTIGKKIKSLPAKPKQNPALSKIPEQKVTFPLTKQNFILMGAAMLLIIVGFLLMTGSPSTADSFNPDIFSTRRIVVGPTIAFLGFVFMGFAIMWRQKDKKSDKEEPTDTPNS